MARLKCPICKVKFKTIEEFKKHAILHKNPRRKRGGHQTGKTSGGKTPAQEDPQNRASIHRHNGNGVATQSSTHVFIYCTCGELYSSYAKKDL